jgi:RimJ/RimL family protein N-acetyltransferase
VRAVSLTQHEITADEHARWWASTVEDPTRAIYIYERGGVPSGVVTFFDLDRESGSSWWGYYLDNAGLAARGELLPAWIQIQREARRLAFGDLGLTVLEGEVLEDNEAVRAFNRRNGFVELDTSTRDIDGVPTRVVRVRATKE